MVELVSISNISLYLSSTHLNFRTHCRRIKPRIATLGKETKLCFQRRKHEEIDVKAKLSLDHLYDHLEYRRLEVKPYTEEDYVGHNEEETRYFKRAKRHNPYFQMQNLLGSKYGNVVVLQTEDLLGHEFTDSNLAMERSINAWSKLLVSWGIEIDVELLTSFLQTTVRDCTSAVVGEV